MTPKAQARITLRGLASDLLAGALCAFITLAYASGFATLIFGGPLAGSVSLGVIAALVSSCVAILILSWRSSFFFALGGPDSNPSAILAVTVASIAGTLLPARASAAPELIPTVLMYLFTSTIGCGLIIFLVGQRRWGRYVRYIPHQVVGGFLVGTGYLLISGGWKMISGVALIHTTASDLQAIPTGAWVTAGGVAVTLLALTRRWNHFLAIPGVIVAATVVFHLGLRLTGSTTEDAAIRGLFIDPLPIVDLRNPFNQPWDLVRWDLILAHASDFAAMTTVAVITILLNATSLDSTVGGDTDFDRELKALGVANLLAGLTGGMVAVNSFNRSILNLRAGAASAWAARASVLFIIGFALLAPGAIHVLPKPVLAGLILYLGMSLLIQWLWDNRQSIPLPDYLIMVAILVTVACFGIVSGVAFGVIASALTFVVSLSKTTVVKHRFTSATRHSNVERRPRDVAWLRLHGAQLQGASLHGHLFFGTSSALLEELREPLRGARVLTLDFWHVRSVDASSVMILRKLLTLATDGGVQVVFTGLSSPLRNRIAACGLDLQKTAVRIFPDLDRGLEWAEDTLLAAAQASVSLADILAPISADEEGIVREHFEICTVKTGTVVVRRGDAADRMFFVLDGNVSVYLPVSGSDYRKRLRAYGPGAIVGEMGFYTHEPRSADIETEAETTLACITRERFTALELSHPRVAARVHSLVVQTLATRLRDANSAIAELL